ncbi:Coenzyme F420 hydrogenase/dehydrogenase, beta subunit C-terminal domain [Desulfosporosinus sp.]|uniref:Coenzyme F420 hydrogenase/dehydrogenase, beta subunit C-terminal domain n=1 Tax=Desulfosporosinus sp. TaxID=157907 RepID=UPI0025B96057|nr:Coenzyme F420 hydrogenase/dehydrogenase, beta subunit C-terminal domain [Desulfosporosinus sp.]MBC2721524.1 Coenzyme F420 hydrogenase/dehydrogenase, beta subunit C-terminal domain [Desulfosporosinus sp.]MBC2726648.1 Coenzyme F420 hydrogenase/dehydrogenase, beta subunit C-terminal domain [Desulfosporosinus sp.]
MEQSKMPSRLRKEVMESGDCTRCGLCVGLCPYIKTQHEHIAFIHDCSRVDGNCYRVCPRTQTNWVDLDRQVFGTERTDHGLGNYLEILYARSLNKEITRAGQYGGVVSTLAAYMVESGQSQGAVLTRGEDNGPPTPYLARNREEVLACAGSNYSASPSLSILNEGVFGGLEDLTTVGRPCQILALRKMQGLTDPSQHNLSARKVNFMIGLFCFWTLETEFYSFLQTKTEGERILRLDIPQNYLVATTEKGDVQVPIDELRAFVRPTCLRCFDPTAEFADVSVGSTENDPEWNTLVIRSFKGQEIVNRVCTTGLLETKPYPEERLPLLLSAVYKKKKRVLEELNQGKGYAYLNLNSDYAKGIEEGGTGL